MVFYGGQERQKMSQLAQASYPATPARQGFICLVAQFAGKPLRTFPMAL